MTEQSCRLLRSVIVSFLWLFLVALHVNLSAQDRFLENGQPTLSGIDAGFFPDSPTRAKIDLAGEWSYSFDGETWRSVKVPSSMDFEGKVLFRRKFSMSEALLEKSAFKLVAFGINNEAEITINDVFVGKHSGAYTSFSFDVPDGALQLGAENVVQVAVQNKLLGRGTLPLRKHIWGWRNYGGITRDIFFVATPKFWVDDVRLRPTIDATSKQGAVDVSITLSNRLLAGLLIDSTSKKAKSASFALQVSLHEKMSDAVVAQSVLVPVAPESNKDLIQQVSLMANSVRPWSAENPDLYVVRVSLGATEPRQKNLSVIDVISVVTGFVQTTTDQQALFVNGVKTPLKGVTWHEDHPLYGGSLTYEQMEKDVVLLKSLGANAVRFEFHPPHPYMINLCNRYGLYAMVELPVVGAPGELLADENFRSSIESYAREMVGRDRASPSVIGWGVGSQLDVADVRTQEFVRTMTSFLKSQDARFVYVGTSMLMRDVASREADALIAAFYPTDLKSFRKQVQDWKKNHDRSPLVFAMYGKEVDHFNRNGRSDPMSQEAQAQFHLQYYGAIKELGLSGSFISAIADWRGDRPLMGLRQPDAFLHPVGLVSYPREKRLAYEVVRALYNDEKVNAIPIGAYRSAFPVAHVLSGLFVIVLVGYFYGYNRRFSDAVRRSLTRSYNFFADLRDYRTVAVMHTMLLVFSVSLTLAVILSSVLYHFRLDRFSDFLLTFFLPWDGLKEFVIRATWNPTLGIVSFTAMFFLLFVAVAAVIKLTSVVIRTRIHWFHAFAVLSWGALPIVFLSPLAMSLFKILENQLYVIPSLVVVAFFGVWTLLRVLNGASVVYDARPAKTYLVGLIVVIVLCGSLYLYYDGAYALSSYVRMIVHVLRSSA
ncbi:MAG: hypothetical protein HY966_07485 [Ignavibacteriales bacterium]|nr:hypothetical protein [Ignavibacteriales bacterium]